MKNILDLIGYKSGRLTALCPSNMRNKKRQIIWKCKCSCGNIHYVPSYDLKARNTKSCGCIQKERLAKGRPTHGMTYTLVYGVWSAMKSRCFNKNNVAYRNYGGRGIIVCDRWLNFEKFFEDMGHKPNSLTLERIDNDGNYTPQNCIWATRKEQARNNRQTKLTPPKVEVIKTLLRESKLKHSEIAEIFNICKSTIGAISNKTNWGDIL